LTGNTFVIDLFMTITNVKTLRQRLIYARELRGLSQAELAKRCKCSQGTIGNVESGERETLRNLVMVARVLNVSADWLFDGKGPKPEKLGTIETLPNYFLEDSGSTAINYSIGRDNFPTQRPEANDSTVVTLPPPKPDKWTVRAIEILAQLNEAQRAACVVNLEIYLTAVGPPKYGQTL
jgi:transcriptional regulator with XRE-family HTH domain